MTEPSLKSKLVAIFRPQPRKSLRSPKRTKRLLKRAQKSNRRIVYLFTLGWGRMISAGLLTYVFFMVPAKPEVGPVLDAVAKGLAALYAYMQVWEVWWRANRSWRVRARRQGHGNNATASNAAALNSQDQLSADTPAHAVNIH
jgi:hypothetical protein